MEFYLSSFGLHNPFISSKLPEHGIYPIGIESELGIDLDYTSLLLGKKYYIDKSAFDFIQEKKETFLKPMANTLNILRDEGHLDFLNVDSIVKENITQIEHMVNTLSADYLTWLKIIREHWQVIENYFEVFHYKYGSKELKELNTSFFPIVNYLNEIDELDNKEKYKRLIRIFESKRTNFKTSEIEEIISISKPLLGQVVINDIVHHVSNKPILNWGDSKPYYDKLNSYRWNKQNQLEYELQLEVKKLFEFIIPSLKPNNIKEVIRFINDDKAVKSLRKELKECLESGEKVSKNWLIKYQEKIIRNDLAVKKKMKVFRWFGSALSVVLPGATVAQEVIIEAGGVGLEDMFEKSQTKIDKAWYLALQSNQVNQ